MNTVDFIFIVPAALAPGLVFAVAVWLDRRRRASTETAPQEEKLLRPPGYSLAIRFDQTLDSILDTMIFAMGLCAIAGVFIVSAARLSPSPVPMLWPAALGILGLVAASAGISMTVRGFRMLKEAQNLRLGLRGEQAVAEALHEVADCGYRVFHDLPGGSDWNIDHVAVGARGVFLIETKARRRRAGKGNQARHVIQIDGDTLRFPTGEDRDAIPQARRNARWLANYLKKKTGEDVCVELFVVVPGWYIEAGPSYPPKAMNAKYLAGYLRKQAEKISPAQVTRIITALDEKCRDVEF